MVIRLNKKAYEGSRFTKNGIKHEEIYFLDGSTPTDVRFQSSSIGTNPQVYRTCREGEGSNRCALQGITIILF